MNYRIKRGDQEFGPYSLADLQQHMQTGHVSAEDLAQSEGMSEWVPVSQVLGNIPIPPMLQPGVYSGMDPNAALAQQIVPLPPNLPWPVLLLSYVSGITPLQFIAIFVWAWNMVQANWARKLSGNNAAMVLMCMYPAGIVSGWVAIAMGKGSGLSGFGALFILAGAICRIVGSFKIRDAMEEYYNTVENIGLSLSGVMTFFFSAIYIQFHINRIARWKKTGMLS